MGRIIRILGYLKRELKNITQPIPVSFKRRLVLRINGFWADKELIYDFKNYSLNDYLPDSPRLFGGSNYHGFSGINKYFHIIPQDKIISNSMLSHHIDVPKNLGYLNKGELMSLNPNYLCDGRSDEVLTDFFYKNPNTFLKPVRGGRGRGAFSLRIYKNKAFINNDPIPITKLKAKLKTLEHYLIQEKVFQDEFWASMFPGSLNTMRLITLRDPVHGEIFMPLGVQRIGNKESAPLDNFSAGGLTCPINMQNGSLGIGGKIISGKVKYYDVHQDSGVHIKGKIIPNWEAIKDKIISVAKQFPYLKFISWDVIVCKGRIIVIEFGNTTDIELFQIHQPLLITDKVKEFFKHHRVRI